MRLQVRLFSGVITALALSGCGETPQGVSCADFACVNGDCDDSSGEPVCTCVEGYAGDRCDRCDDGFRDDGQGGCVELLCEENTCNGHGDCDDSSGEPVCACDEGYTGDRCDRCDGGFGDDGQGGCVEDALCGENTCNGHGDCDDSSGEPVCACDEGYAGDRCDRCAAGYEEEPVGSGMCVVDPCHDGDCRIFYIRDDGDDSDDGLSDSTAWAHAPWQRSCSGSCSDYSYQSGDHFLFKCGDEWTEHVALDVDDQDDLTFGAYHGDGIEGVSGDRPRLTIDENRAFYITGGDIDGLVIQSFWITVTGSGNDCRCILGRSDGANDWTIDDIDCNSTEDGLIMYFTDGISVTNNTWHCGDDPASFLGEPIREMPVHQTANGRIEGNVFAVTGGGSDAFQVHTANDTIQSSDCVAADEPWDCCSGEGTGSCGGERYFTLTGPNWVLRHNEFTGGNEDGIDINGVAGVVIEHNYLHDNNNTGINLGHGPDGFICRYNWSHNNGADVEGDAGNAAIGVGGAMGNGVVQYSNGGEISYNLITGSFQNGIHFGGEVTDILVHNNTIVGDRDGGDASDTDVMTGGFYFRGNFSGSGIQLVNNIVYSANEAFTTLVHIDSADATPGVGVDLQDNHYYHSASPQIFDIAGAADVSTVAEVQEQWAGQEAGSEHGDPLFGDDGESSSSAIAAGRYYLQSTSPCVDTGASLGGDYGNCWSAATALPPDLVTLLNQDELGSGWEKGIYGF